MSAFTDAIKKEFYENDEIRDAGLATPAEVQREDDIIYGPDTEWNKLDLYRPSEFEGRLPVIVSYHGGGWVYGDKERYQYYCMSLSKRGFAVVNFTYRLAPMFRHPAPLEDMNLVAEWVMKNADRYSLDPDRIFGIGDSAGANGIGNYAAILTNADYAERFPFQAPKGFSFRAVGMICGTYKVDLENPDDVMTMKLVREYLPGGGTQDELDELCVWDHLTPSYPPVFAASGSGDFLKIQIPHLIQRLLANEIPFDTRFYCSENGPLGHDFHVNVRLKEAAECADDLCAFFNRFK